MTDLSSAVDTDIRGLQTSITDALLMGDQIVGQQGNRDLVQQTKERNRELKENKEKIEKDIRKKEAIINRANRDFSDTKVPPTSALHVIEDYTMAMVAMSYLFLVLVFIWWYTLQAETILSGLLRSLLFSALGSVIVAMVLYYVV